MRLTVKSDILVLEAMKVEEMRRGLGRASAPSELVRLHHVAVNSHLSLFLQAGGAPGRMSRAILRWEKPGVGLST